MTVFYHSVSNYSIHLCVNNKHAQMHMFSFKEIGVVKIANINPRTAKPTYIFSTNPSMKTKSRNDLLGEFCELYILRFTTFFMG